MAFDFTPSFTHGNLSRNGNFTNSEFVEALNDEYNNNTDEWNERLLDPFKPTNISLGLWLLQLLLDLGWLLNLL